MGQTLAHKAISASHAEGKTLMSKAQYQRQLLYLLFATLAILATTALAVFGTTLQRANAAAAPQSLRTSQLVVSGSSAALTTSQRAVYGPTTPIKANIFFLGTKDDNKDGVINTSDHTRLFAI